MAVADRLLAERMELLNERSPTWKTAVDSLWGTSFRVLVGTPDQVRRLVPELADHPLDNLGEVIPLLSSTGEMIGAVAVVDVETLTEMVRAAGLPRSVLEEDLDRILIHEVYGHVVPFALSGGCADPLPGETVLSACSIRRENRIRRELDMPVRTTYDLRGLTVGQVYAWGSARGAARAP